MTSHSPSDSVTIPVHKFGHKEKATLLAFHGFAQNAKSFLPLTDYKSIYSFDLPYHGSKPMNYDNQQSFIQQFDFFFQQNPNQQFELMAFSIGCRLAFSLLMAFPQKFTRAILIAPEGLQFHPVYTFATKTIIGNWCFKTCVNQYQHFFQPILYFAKKLKLAPKTLIKIAEAQMGSLAKRERVYQTWMRHRDFEISIEKLAQVIVSQQIQLEFVLGKRDKIIQYQHIEPLCKHLEDYPYSLKLLDCGHFNLLDKYLNQYKPLVR